MLVIYILIHTTHLSYIFTREREKYIMNIGAMKETGHFIAQDTYMNEWRGEKKWSHRPTIIEEESTTYKCSVCRYYRLTEESKSLLLSIDKNMYREKNTVWYTVIVNIEFTFLQRKETFMVLQIIWSSSTSKNLDLNLNLRSNGKQGLPTAVVVVVEVVVTEVLVEAVEVRGTESLSLIPSSGLFTLLPYACCQNCRLLTISITSLALSGYEGVVIDIDIILVAV